MKLRWYAIALSCIAAFFIDRFVIGMMPFIRNSYLDSFFGWISSALLSIILMICIISIAMWEDRKRKWIIPLWLSAFFSLAVAEILKLIFLRERPLGLEKTFMFLKDYSFPSAHAAVCFAILPILDREYPHFRVFWIAIASLVAFSRLYLGVHYLSDVVAGAALGYLIGFGIMRIAEGKLWKRWS